MTINYMLVFVAAVVQFILGGLWYSPLLFGRWWMQIMEADHLSKDEMKAMQKQVMPLYAIQFFLGLFTTIAFANLIPYITTFSIYHIAFWIWIGFIVPLQIAAVIWGKTQKRFWTKQIFVMISYQLVAIMLTAWILMF